MSGGSDKLKERYSAEYLGITDNVLLEMWGIIQENIGGIGVGSSSFAAALRGFDARIKVLQVEIMDDMKCIMERNEASSKRMACVSYIMLIVAVVALVVSIISLIKCSAP